MYIKNVIYLFAVLFLFSCGSDESATLMEDAVIPQTCDSDEMHIDFESPAFSGSLSNCWLDYIVPDPQVQISGVRLAYLNWDYDSNPGIDNSIIFQYSTEDLFVGSFAAKTVYGLTSYSGGNDATVLQCSGGDCGDFQIEITAMNEQDGFACGSFSGNIFDQNMQAIFVSGNFKAMLNP